MELSAGPSAASCVTALSDESFLRLFDEDDKRVTELSNREGVRAHQPKFSSFHGTRQRVRSLSGCPVRLRVLPMAVQGGSPPLSVQGCQSK